MKRSGEHKKFLDSTLNGDYARLSATAVSIVDTPTFQRLRALKQLGMTEYVYPGATHTRFAHSLGVANRAKDFALRLKAKQPDLLLTDSDLVVLEVAGLCHDLGHGPFSHSFQTELVPKLLPAGEEWEHEQMSCRLVDHICEHYTGDLSPEEQMRVKDLIIGDREEAKADWTGREWHFDIVANKRNGLDVDKLDYLKRDNAACGEQTTSRFSSLYENMRVIDGEVCFRSSVRSVVQDVYSARAKLHECVYTHPVAKGVEYMVTDALLLAADELSILDALRDPELFDLLDDTIVRGLERSKSTSPGVQAAKELLRRLRVRDIYKHCGSVDIPQDVESLHQVTAEQILELQDVAAVPHLLPSDVRVHNLKIDYTMKNHNPMEHVGFYVNDDDEGRCALPLDGAFTPSSFITRKVRVYLVRLCDSCEEKEQYVGAVKAVFAAWSKRMLPTQQVISPSKSTVTAAGRKRQRTGPGTSSQRDNTFLGSRPASVAGTAADGAGCGEAAVESRFDDQIDCSQSAPQGNGPPAKKASTFQDGSA